MLDLVAIGTLAVSSEPLGSPVDVSGPAMRLSWLVWPVPAPVAGAGPVVRGQAQQWHHHMLHPPHPPCSEHSDHLACSAEVRCSTRPTLLCDVLSVCSVKECVFIVCVFCGATLINI